MNHVYIPEGMGLDEFSMGTLGRRRRRRGAPAPAPAAAPSAVILAPGSSSPGAPVEEATMPRSSAPESAPAPEGGSAPSPEGGAAPEAPPPPPPPEEGGEGEGSTVADLFGLGGDGKEFPTLLVLGGLAVVGIAVYYFYFRKKD